MKILVTGGNGNISWWFVKLAVDKGHQVYALGRNFEKPTRRNLPNEVIKLQSDIRNIEETKKVLNGMTFDVVCDFLCFDKNQANDAIELFENITNHYIFISSEAIYKRETKYLPFKETTPQVDLEVSGNYIKGKIEAEQVFKDAYQKLNFPVTIIRPSFTYDTLMPTSIGLNCFTAINRYQKDNIALIAGDGTNLWSFTHARDFGRALLGIAGNEKSIGEDYHITTDEWLTWLDATEIILKHLKLPNCSIIHIPNKNILEEKVFGDFNLNFNKLYHNIYDNSKIKQLLPNWKAEINFEEGIKETIDWLFEDAKHQRINKILDEILINYTRNLK
ncbi:GDP-mannose 4,6-dehydratase [Aliarcobacter cryaerophilus]|uniref:NAD-dependent epimerase/dehydratase family protein n=1 Tax=Aliarcobacter cryaerophilus TaxID=28198 RepID=UPI0021B5E5D7|nr:NAD-dependent epimerase/dehydratase family protein [Aliarcobacter cryaerophilus]MCT7489214.1 GDP-mannose 4,6-dehydratase [Aliarcobacter cryaerophilus]